MRRSTSVWIAVLVHAIALGLFAAGISSCSSTQWAKTKAHAVESGAAGLGGAAAVTVGGPLGFLIFVSLATIGVIVNEQLQPPDKVLVITLDASGKVIKTERFQPTETTGAPKAGGGGLFGIFGFFADFTWTVAKWILFVWLLVVLLKWKFGDRYREHVKGFFVHAGRSLRAVAKAKLGDAFSEAGGALRRAGQASGMKHTKGPALRPRTRRG